MTAQQLNHNNIMTKYTKTIGALAATTMLMGGYATAQLEGEVSVGYTNMYEFRFIDFGQDLINGGADVAYSFADGWAINGGAWYGSTNDLSGTLGNLNELDVYAGVSKEFGPVTVELGYIFYHFPDVVAADTQEIYAKVSAELGAGFGVGVTGYLDIQRLNGYYIQPEVTWSTEFSECLSLEMALGCALADGMGSANGSSVSVGQLSREALVGGGNPGGTVDGFQGWYVSASLPWKAMENLTITPFVKYTDGASDLLTNLTDITGGQDYLIGGVSLGVSF